jgi:uncharacterized protein YbbK (DUF523 family)
VVQEKNIRSAMENRSIIICSACLLGINCKYNGKNNYNDKVADLLNKQIIIPVCPEQLGGQTTPRLDAEIQNGGGQDVLNNKAKVVESNGNEVTVEFIKGANEVLKIAKMYNAHKAILKQGSPSCGSGRIYDGTFSKKSVKNDGVTTALLKNNGISVISEEEV